MNEQTMRFRLGIFVLGSVILLAVLLILFGGFPNLFRRYDHYTVLFNDASGLSPGTPVRRSGVRIGEVEKVELDNETGKVRVGIKVDSRYTLRKGDQPVVARGLIGGDSAIDFVRPRTAPQPPDTTPVEPGAVLTGRPQPDAGDIAKEVARVMPTAEETLASMQKVFNSLDRMTPLVEQSLRELRDVAKETRATIPELRRTSDELQVAARNWGKVGERLDVLLRTNEDKLVKSLDNLNEALKRVNATFNEENQRNLTEGLRNLRNGTSQLDSLTRNTDELIKESRKTVQRVNDSVTRSNQVLDNMQKATRPLADRSESLTRNLDESAAKLNQIMGALGGFVGGTGRTDGTLQRFLNDPSLYNHLDEAACGVARLLPRMDRALQDLEIFADKIARHPEALGIGGVVRPSVGLK